LTAATDSVRRTLRRRDRSYFLRWPILSIFLFIFALLSYSVIYQLLRFGVQKGSALAFAVLLLIDCLFASMATYRIVAFTDSWKLRWLVFTVANTRYADTVSVSLSSMKGLRGYFFYRNPVSGTSGFFVLRLQNDRSLLEHILSGNPQCEVERKLRTLVGMKVPIDES
jgi:hypothetical protein